MKLFLKGNIASPSVPRGRLGFAQKPTPRWFNLLGKMITRMQETGVHEAVRRNVVRILQDVEIPHRSSGEWRRLF